MRHNILAAMASGIVLVLLMPQAHAINLVSVCQGAGGNNNLAEGAGSFDCIIASADVLASGSSGIDFHATCTGTVHKDVTTTTTQVWIFVYSKVTVTVVDHTTSEVSCSGSFSGQQVFRSGTGLMGGSALVVSQYTKLGHMSVDASTILTDDCNWLAGVTTCSAPLSGDVDYKETGIAGIPTSIQLCATVRWVQSSALSSNLFADGGDVEYCSPEVAIHYA